MSYILNIETATKNCSVALAKEGKTILCKEIAEEGYSHAERLHVFIEEIIKEAGIIFQDLLEGKPDTYSPFRPGMTATVDIVTKTRPNVLAVPISSVVVKSDTTAVKGFKVEDEAADKKAAPKSDKKLECVFVKVGDKAKIRIIKTGIQDDTNIEVISGLKKGDVVITGPYTTVSKDLNSGDKVTLDKVEEKK